MAIESSSLRPRVSCDKVVRIMLVRDDVVPAGDGVDGKGELKAAAHDQIVAHVKAKLQGDPRITDVVVYAGEPWHFAGGRLRKHPEVHKAYPDTVLRVFRKRGEKVVWWSEDEFRVTDIQNEDPRLRGKMDDPFGEPIHQGWEDDAEGRPIWVARSTVPLPSADGQQFKITFTMQGKKIDPNMECDGSN